MSARGGLRHKTIAVVVAALAMIVSARVNAQDADSSTREASKHFQRAVALYGEADYRASLVEFKRAYALAPNVAVLYNVGETEYQLQDYASALVTFKRYLAESPANEPHRAEVEGDVEILRSRVGHVSVATLPVGADITIDDQPVGKTPLDEAALVSIGHRKIVASMPGRLPVSKFVDVAAEDNVSVTLTLPVPAESGAAPLASTSPGEGSSGSRGIGPTLRVVGWVATAAFAGGAVTFGVLANKASSDLKRARNVFPTTTATLNHDANLATTYAAVADSLTAAAIVVGDITLFSTLSAASKSSRKGAIATETRVVVGPTSARLDVTF
jgi:tetratricopeptide (TPR) repeat protein